MATFFIQSSIARGAKSLLVGTAAILSITGAGLTHAGASRTFVSTTGSDANTAVNCGPNTPCRNFSAAMSVTNSGGEIVALTSGGYGVLSITDSVLISAAPGVHAAITATTGDAITINAPGKRILLKGLFIKGAGATNGINILNAHEVEIVSCTIAAFTTGINATPVSDGIGNRPRVNVYSSYLANNITGFRLGAGTGSVSQVNGALVNSMLSSHDRPVYATDGGRILVENSTVTSCTDCLYASAAGANSTANITASHSAVAFGSTAVKVETADATASAKVFLSGNNFNNVGSSGNGAVFDASACTGTCAIQSAGNNGVSLYSGALENPAGAVTSIGMK